MISLLSDDRKKMNSMSIQILLLFIIAIFIIDISGRDSLTYAARSLAIDFLAKLHTIYK